MKTILLLLLLIIGQAAAQDYQLATLPQAHDPDFINSVQGILDSWHYTGPFTPGNFSCTDTSILAKLLLESQGFNVVAVTDTKGNSSLSGEKTGHMWIAVEDPRHKGFWIEVETVAGFGLDYKPLDYIYEVTVGDTRYESGYITTDPLGYELKYQGSRAQNRKHYSLSDGRIEANRLRRSYHPNAEL